MPGFPHVLGIFPVMEKIMGDERKLAVYLSEKKEHILMFSFSVLRAKCLMSAQQLAAEIKTLFRDGEVQMERAALSYVCNAANAPKNLELLTLPSVILAS